MTTPLPREVPTTPVSAQQGLELQLDRLKQSMARLTKQNEILTAQAAKLKGKKDAKSLATLARINAQYRTNKARFQADKDKFKSTQIKLYEATGQYDKLLTGTDRDAFLAVKTLFKGYGLESLAGKIYDYVKNGYSSDTISILLQDSAEYKARFAGNEARTKAGLPVLSPGEYLAVESSYRQIMQTAGLPIGFYDQNSDFTDWIAKNISPSEIQSRVDLATQATVLAPPAYRQALQQMGISSSEMTAYFLDSTKALPYLQKSAATAAIGSEAIQQGLTFDQTYAQQLAERGVTAAEAQQGYSQVAQELGTMQSLGSIYGEQWGQRESEQSVFGTSAEAAEKKRGLLSRERGAFAGAAGSARAGLGSRGGQK